MDPILFKIFGPIITDLVGQAPGILGGLLGTGTLSEKDLIRGTVAGMKELGHSDRRIILWVMTQYGGMAQQDVLAALKSDVPADPGGGTPVDPGNPVAPPVEPPPDPGSTLIDDVPVHDIQFMEPPDAGGWQIVSDLDIQIQGNRIMYLGPVWDNHPAVAAAVGKGGAISGNFWVGMKNGGVWQMCPWEWHRPGQDWCAKHIFHIEGHLCHGMTKRAPAVGEDVIFMSSTGARVGMYRTDMRHERSRIALRQWR
jgi:hypothetical protein